MANRIWLCLLLFYLVLNCSNCKRFSSGGFKSSWSRGSSSSSAFKPSSSYKHSYPSSSGSFGSSRQSSHSYPSSSSSLSGSSSNTNLWSPWRNSNTGSKSSTGTSGSGSGSKYPASSGLSGSGSYPWLTGLSGSNSKYPASSGLSGSGSSSKYPGSPGLSGTGNGYTSIGTGSGNKYPASSGLSGSGSGSKYPASTGLSGSGSYPWLTGLSGSNSKYPASSGLSGSGSSSKYPASTGLSGIGTGNSWSSGSSGLNVGSGKHSYPTTSTGLIGSNIHDPSKPYYKPSYNVHSNPSPPYHQSNSYNTNSAFGSGPSGNNHYSYGHSNFYTAPQHVYITEYRNSNSRFGDLLTGLTLYNLGRSHSHYHDHYYYDDYYRQRYNTATYQRPYEKPKDEAYCTLRVKENDKIEILKIPCEIVSTFTEGSKKSSTTETQTVCVSNYTITNNTQSVPEITQSNITLSTNNNNNLHNNETLLNLNIIPINATVAPLPNITVSISNSTSNSSSLPDTSGQNINVSTTTKPIPLSINTTAPMKNQSVTTTNISIMNTTKCTSTTDPLSVKGPPVNIKNMDCEVNIVTKDSRYNTKIDCQKLIQYSKTPEPPKTESPIVPAKSRLKSWLSNPPWWMSLFIAL